MKALPKIRRDLETDHFYKYLFENKFTPSIPEEYYHIKSRRYNSTIRDIIRLFQYLVGANPLTDWDILKANLIKSLGISHKDTQEWVIEQQIEVTLNKISKKYTDIPKSSRQKRRSFTNREKLYTEILEYIDKIKADFFCTEKLDELSETIKSLRDLMSERIKALNPKSRKRHAVLGST